MEVIDLEEEGAEELEAERALKLENEGKHSEHPNSILATINVQQEEYKQPIVTQLPKAKESIQLLMVGRMFNYFHIIGYIVGFEFNFEWKPLKCPRFYFSCLVYFTACFNEAYTVYLHYNNGDYIRILEPLALLGMIISVIIFCLINQLVKQTFS